MENCDYKCNKERQITGPRTIVKIYIQPIIYKQIMEELMKRIRDIYRDEKKGEHFYELSELIDMINVFQTISY